MFARSLFAVAAALLTIGAQRPPIAFEQRPVHPWTQACEDWDEWDKPGPAFQVFGNTYYVGTCGIASILITSDKGHVLIDSGTEAGAELVLSNVRSLGFDPRDVKLLLNSHEHFDHVGGMAKLQEATGAEIVSSFIGAQVMLSGHASEEDPQAGMHEPMRPVRSALDYSDQKAQRLLHDHDMWPISTPGHTPGAMSWTWRACEGERCQTVVYADSLSAVSRDDYRFRDHQNYLKDVFSAIERISETRCDLVLTPHPSASQMKAKLIGGDLAKPIGAPCRAYATLQSGNLFARILKEDPEYYSNLIKEVQAQNQAQAQ